MALPRMSQRWQFGRLPRLGDRAGQESPLLLCAIYFLLPSDSHPLTDRGKGLSNAELSHQQNPALAMRAGSPQSGARLCLGGARLPQATRAAVRDASLEAALPRAAAESNHKQIL